VSRALRRFAFGADWQGPEVEGLGLAYPSLSLVAIIALLHDHVGLTLCWPQNDLAVIRQGSRIDPLIVECRAVLPNALFVLRASHSSSNGCWANVLQVTGKCWSVALFWSKVVCAHP
jgi:hypothetical protein